MEQGYGGYGAWSAGPANTQGAYGAGVASWQAPSVSIRLILTTPGLACLSTIPTAPATATTTTLTWGPSAMGASAVSTATAGTPPASGAPLIASCGAGARAASRTGATPTLSCEVTPSCPRQPPPSLCLLPGMR
ncbi:A-kinase anchoring protein 8 [Rhinolophus ferrumequinum]|uniref:A-kinase anchoring protein 8 n=1 Tax=Rhinolophus ferrumequinum TaxID=59479 RepID=A0A7J7TYL3_RHIFE|nr:A-kinase anchoring protein 8 [Rhinolophus ferrumequinum]